MKRRLFYSGLLAATLLLLQKPLYATDVSEAEVKAMEEQALAQRMEHKKLQAQALQISLELTKIKDEMIKAAQKLQNDEEKTTKMENELAVLEQQLNEAQTAFNRENKNLIKTLSSLQNLALHPNQALLVQPLSPLEMLRSALLLQKAVPYLSANAQKIKADLEDLNARQQKVKNQLEKVKIQKDSLAKQQAAMQKMSTQKNKMRQQIEGESQRTREQAERLSSQASDLRDLWEKIEHEREIKRRRDEEIRRAAREREEKARQAYLDEQRRKIRVETVEDNAKKGSNFAKASSSAGLTGFSSARGKLAKPARGTVITSYGEELSKGVTSKGMLIKTRPSAQVIAPYDGSVVFAGPFKGYGNLIIIDHGQSYMLLLAGMASVDAEPGQLVLAGEPVGIMPDGDKAKLYLEIRKDKRPINPEPWFGS